MSWLFSQALVAAYSAECSRDGEPCAALNRMDTAQPFLRNGKTMDFSRLSRSGVTCAVLTADHGAALLTWFRGDFLARTYRWQAQAKGLTVPDPACGVNSSASYARFDPASHLWRTAQLSLLEDSPASLQTLPRSGVMRRGALLEQRIRVPGTSASGCGLLPTLMVPNGGRSVAHVTDWRSDRTAYHNGKKVQIDLATALKRLPTLTVHGNNNRRGLTPQSGDGLATALRKLPTITVQDAANNGGPSQAERNTPPLNAVIGGPLNPEWCEWFMGWPIGWTGLAPLATDRFQSWLNAHGRG